MTNMYLSVLSLLFLSVMANNSSCGSGTGVFDCQNVDLGSCGNACCALQLEVPFIPKTAFLGMQLYLGEGGTDSSYDYVQGPDAAGHNPGTDLRSKNIIWKWIFQGRHTTIGGYVDVLDFNIKESPNTGSSIITMFSSSGIHGALGDNGQNYKSLSRLARDLGFPTDYLVLYGCGKK